MVLWASGLALLKRCSEELGPLTTATIQMTVAGCLGFLFLAARGYLTRSRLWFLARTEFHVRAALFSLNVLLVNIALAAVPRTDLPLLTLVNYTMRGVDQQHRGVELGVEGGITSTISMNAALGTGRFVYSSRPQATITRDNSDEVFATDRTVYWKNYRVGGMPQTAGSLGVRYNSPKFWFISLTANYFADIYLDPNPDRRTAEALDGLVVEDPQWNALLEQTRLDNAFTVDLFGGKSWMVQRKYRIALNVSVSNLLDNRDFVVGGFEQLRYERMDVDKFPPRLSYLFGRTYFAMLSIGF